MEEKFIFWLQGVHDMKYPKLLQQFVGPQALAQTLEGAQ